MIQVFGLMSLLALIVMGINSATGTEWVGQVVMSIVIGIPFGFYLIDKLRHEKESK